PRAETGCYRRGLDPCPSASTASSRRPRPIPWSSWHGCPHGVTRAGSSPSRAADLRGLDPTGRPPGSRPVRRRRASATRPEGAPTSRSSRLLLRARSRGLARLRSSHDHGAVSGARDRAPNEEQVLVRAHGDDLDVGRRHALGPIPARHALAFENATRIRAVADRAAVPEVLVRAVRRRKPAETVALHHAGRAATLADAGDLDALAGTEHVGHRECRADGGHVAVGQT